ncbi:MAG: aspartate/glutamate racemase family protein [Cyclobacteriaceae bacterium]
MKTIGMIGGMSWESSKLYYEFVNTRVKKVVGGSHSAKCLMVSVDFAKIEELTFAGNWDEMGEMMADCAKQLERGGADIIILCTNTIHLVSDYITNATKIPFLHIAEATGEAIVSQQLKKVALLGTRFTMEKDFYTKMLTERFGLEVVIPEEDERKVIHHIIYSELVLGQFKDTSRDQCLTIIERLQEEGAEGIIMGCTELPILIPDSEVDVPTFDTGKIHAEAAVDWALAK